MTQVTLHARIPGTDLDVFPLCLGGNVFGWTANEEASFEILDAYAAGGGNFVDSADAYSAWVPGNAGGESETIIGRWLASRGNRDQVVVATKVFAHPQFPGLSRANIRAAVDASLRRLGTDHIDLYYAHRDDPDVPLEETVAAFGELVSEGKVRAVAASNFSAGRLSESLRIAGDLGVARYVALQPHYNLVERGEFESTLAGLLTKEGLVAIPYYALANGFLTGKYRQEPSSATGRRAERAVKYLDERGLRVLAALDAVAGETGASVTAVSLAWLRSRPTVIAPIASASRVSQVPDLLAGAGLELTGEHLERLTAASE